MQKTAVVVVKPHKRTIYVTNWYHNVSVKSYFLSLPNTIFIIKFNECDENKFVFLNMKVCFGPKVIPLPIKANSDFKVMMPPFGNVDLFTFNVCMPSKLAPCETSKEIIDKVIKIYWNSVFTNSYSVFAHNYKHLFLAKWEIYSKKNKEFDYKKEFLKLDLFCEKAEVPISDLINYGHST